MIIIIHGPKLEAKGLFPLISMGNTGYA